MELDRLVKSLPKDFVVTLVDVGSAGGLHKRWKPFSSILSAVLFDPREAAPSGGFGPGQSRIYPVALSDRSGEATLHVTALPNMSSFLRPDADVMARYRKKGADTQIVGDESCPTERLDALAEKDGFRPDVLKVDTQGSELMVLNGANESLTTVVLAEIEVSFFQRYVGQPLFSDIEAWMKDHGFELLELYRLKRYRAANSLGLRKPLLLDDEQRTGRVAYGDAIFLRNEESMLAAAAKDEGLTLLKAAVALIAYGKTDHAAALLDRGGHLLPSESLAAIAAALSAHRRRRRFPRLAHLLRRTG
jgi:FkbM family methyltransferase